VVRGQKLAGIQPGHRVLVIGSGIAGLLHVQMARALGAGRIIATDLSDFRLKAARELGADETLHANEDIPARLRQVNDGRLADVVVLCTGASPAIRQALLSADRGGTVLFFAAAQPEEKIPFPINDLFWRNEITLTSSYAGAPADHHTALELIRARRIRVREMITHRLGLSEAALGFRLVTEAKESIRVIIEPQR
ncbi:MAG: zinc-binding dehydrogenase, partial [Nitrospirae bacterium]|nr:zinc-binding dehydrogenase [Nitrospirota bacterium]